MLLVVVEPTLAVVLPRAGGGGGGGGDGFARPLGGFLGLFGFFALAGVEGGGVVDSAARLAEACSPRQNDGLEATTK